MNKSKMRDVREKISERLGERVDRGQESELSELGMERELELEASG